MWKFRIKEQWQNTTIKLTFIFGIFFTVAVALLLGFIYWRTTIYLGLQAKSALEAMVRSYSQLDRNDLNEQIEYGILHDARHIVMLGLFNVEKEPIAGNLSYIPQGLDSGGNIYRISYNASLRHLVVNVQREDRIYPIVTAASEKQIAGIALMQMVRLKSGEWLVVGRDVTLMMDAQRAIEDALLGGGSLILLLGWAGGVMISRRPVRRINEIRDAARKIMLGDLQLRVPCSNQHDELDMLAETVNRMLDEVARLLAEVKSVTDTIAHDLRTPLTRLRALLYRTLQESEMDHHHYAMFEQAVQETDILLGRFRALLRIAEIENRERRAGFIQLDLTNVIEQIVELFLPLAEEKGITVSSAMTAVPPVLADPDLLFEALSNLVDNAIKFTPMGGCVEINLVGSKSGPVIEIRDSGPGVPANEREAILKRFYRSDRDRLQPGYGLGLSIVNAIVQLHGFKLQFKDTETGTYLSLYCWPHPIQG